jgi:chromate transporter
MTAISQTFSLEVDLINYLVLGISALLLLGKIIPAPLIIILVAILGLIL